MSQPTSLALLRASSAELLGPPLNHDGLSSLGTAFLIPLSDRADPDRHFALTAHHCVVEANALGQAPDIRLRFADRTIALKRVAGFDSYLTGNDIAILELAGDPELPPLPCAALRREDIVQTRFLVRGCAA